MLTAPRPRSWGEDPAALRGGRLGLWIRQVPARGGSTQGEVLSVALAGVGEADGRGLGQTEGSVPACCLLAGGCAGR